jgi:hypothetical protein
MSTIGMQANLGIKDDLRCGVLAGRALGIYVGEGGGIGVEEAWDM